MLAKIWVKAGGGWWRHRQRCLAARGPWRRVQIAVNKLYVEQMGAYVGFQATFAGPPVFPHKLFGVFVAPYARIGERVTIYQHVMIARNDLPGSRTFGVPTIGDDVYIGAGAKIVGSVTIGDGARIGAGAVVVHDVPPGATVVGVAARTVERAQG